jgi:large subunit ribosomal protein L10
VLSASDINVLADLPPRDTLLAQFAGALSAPMQQLAGLIQALPRNLAFGLSALIDQRRADGGGGGEPAADAGTDQEAPVAEAPETETAATAAGAANADPATDPGSTDAPEGPAAE